MNQRKKLKWGETPFDHMSQEELLTHSKRMFMALMSAHNSLNMIRQMTLQQDPHNCYWTGNGSGSEAFQNTLQAIHDASNGYSSEDIYRSYFRYAPNLFFDAWPGSKMDNWLICGGCGQMHGVSAEAANETIGMKHTDIPHPDKNCQGIFRRLTVGDLKPVK